MSPAFSKEEQRIEYLEKRAEKGDTFSQNALASIYILGDTTTPKDYAKGIFWFQQSANLGSCFAQMSLGDIYYRGAYGLAQDYEKAAHWFERAAIQEDVYSQKAVGVMYLLGLGVQKDLKKSLYWYESAAYLGDADAQIQAALILMVENVNVNQTLFEKGYIWLLVAEKKGEHIPTELKEMAKDELKSKDLDSLKRSAERIYAQIQENDRPRECPDDNSLIRLRIFKCLKELHPKFYN